jgi:hypothetical protein
MEHTFKYKKATKDVLPDSVMHIDQGGRISVNTNSPSADVLVKGDRSW